MTDTDTSIPHAGPAPMPAEASHRGPFHPSRRKGTIVAGLAGLGLLAVGAGAGAAGWSALQDGPQSFDPALASTPVAQLSDDDRVELQGKVTEIYGNKFVVDDGTGRALVETGRAGEGGKLVAANETVTVQGRFEDGSLKATALQRADGSVEELRPAPPPPPPHRRP